MTIFGEIRMSVRQLRDTRLLTMSQLQNSTNMSDSVFAKRKSARDSAPSYATLTLSLLDAEKEKNQLSASCKVSSLRISDLVAQVKEHKSEIETLNLRLSDAENVHLQERRNLISKLDEEVKKVKAASSQKDTKIASLMIAIKSMEDELKARDVTLSQKEVEQKAAVDSVHKESESKSQQMSELVNTKIREIQFLKEELARKIKAAEDLQSIIMNFNEEKRKLEEDIESSRSQNLTNKMLQKKLREYKERSATHSETIQELKSKLYDNSQKLLEVKKGKEVVEKEMRDSQERSETEKESIKEQFRVQVQQFQNLMNQRKSSDESLVSERVNWEREKVKLTEQLISSKKLHQEIEIHLSEKIKQYHRLEKLQRSTEERVDIERKKVDEERKRFDIERESWERSLRTVNERNANIEGEYTKLLALQKTMKTPEEVNQLCGPGSVKELHELKARVQSLKVELKAVKLKSYEDSTKLKLQLSSEKEQKEAKSKISSLEKRKSDLKKKLNEMEKELQETKELLGKEKARSKEYQEDCEKVSKRLAEKTQSLKKLQSQLAKCADDTMKMEGLEQANHLLVTEKSQLFEKLQTLHGSLKKAEERLNR